MIPIHRDQATTSTTTQLNECMYGTLEQASSLGFINKERQRFILCNAHLFDTKSAK